jgi:uncharacterized protein involved in tellurium resistance
MEKTKQSAKEFIYDISSEASLLTESYIARFSSRKERENYKGNWRQSINSDKPKPEQVAWLVQHPKNNQVNFQVNIAVHTPDKPNESEWIKLKDQALKTSTKGEVIFHLMGGIEKFNHNYVAVNYTINLIDEKLDSNRITDILPDVKKVLDLFVNFASQYGIADIKTKKTREVLTEKNQEVKSKLADSFKVRLRWFKDIDFDLAALYTLKNGEKGLVYFGNKGSLTSNPYINLDKDAMYGGADEKVETLSVINKNHIDKVSIICWDYTNSGGSSAFDRSNVNVAISDNNDNLVIVKPTTASGNDSVCIAEISFNADGVAVKNKSVSFKRSSSSATDIYNIIK